MDSDDFSLIDIGDEDDSLLLNIPSDDAGRFACSPLVAAGSTAYSRPPKSTVLKGKVHYGEVGSTLPNNKENLNESCNMKLGSSNLSLDPQKMKRNRKAGGYNLRKSLAWDKAFFTEEGVLSTLELSMICGTPSKHDGKHLPAIFEEQRTPMHANTTPAELHTVESNSFRKLHCSSNKDKRTGEGSNMKQKPLASGSLKSKRSTSTTSAKTSERKEGSSSRNFTPTSNKRLLSTSPAKPLSQLSKMSKVPNFKPDAHLSSTTASSSGASHVKRNRIAPPVPSAQKQLGQKGGSNTRSTSNGPNIISQRIPKPSKCSDQRTRKSRTVPCSREQSSTSHKVSNTKRDTSSEIITGKMLPVGLEGNDGTCKAAVSVKEITGNTSTIQQSIQHQVAKPSGLRMPSPSLRFFGQSKIPIATMDRIPAPGPAQPCSVSTVLPNAGTILGVIQSRTPEADVERVSVPSPVQPCSGSSINIPKIHDELVHVKKDDLIVTLPALLDGKPLKQVNNECLEEVDKHLVELDHTCFSTEGVEGEDKRSVSPVGKCRFNDANLLQISEDKLITRWIDNRSGFQAQQGQNDLPVMSVSLGLESEFHEYALQTPNGSNCCPEMLHRTNGCKEVEELHCPSHVTEEVSQFHDGLYSNTTDLLNRSFSPQRTSQSEAIDDVVPEIDVYKPLVMREVLSASLQNIADTTNRIQELQVLQCPLPRTDKQVQSADGINSEDNSVRIVTDEDKATEPFPLEVALSVSLDTKRQAEEDMDLSVAEYTNQTDLTNQNANLELQMSPRGWKSKSEVDLGVCNVDLSLSQGQRLGSTDAELSAFESDKQDMIYDELLGEPLMQDEATIAFMYSNEAVCEEVPLELALSVSLDTKRQAEEHVDLSVAEYTNQTDLTNQNADLELQMSPRVWKSTGEVDAGICNVDLSLSQAQRLGSTDAELSAFESDKQHMTSDEPLGQPLMQDEPTLAFMYSNEAACEEDSLEVALSVSLDTKRQAEEHVDLSVADYTNLTDLTNQNADLELQTSPRACKSTSEVDAGICDVDLSLSQAQSLGSTGAELSGYECDKQQMISDELLGEPLMPDEAISALMYSKEAVCEGISVICDDNQLINISNMEMLVNANKNRCQTSNSPATNDSEACSPHSSVGLSFPLKVSKEYSNDKDKVEADYQMTEEPLSPSLNNQQVVNHVILVNDYASGNDSMSDQAIIQEPQSSSQISGDCTTPSAAYCDTMVSSSPCKYESTIMRNESMERDDKGEQVELANHLEDIHDVVNEDEKTSSRIVKDGKTQLQLVIRPPGDVAPFSDEWLAAVEAAGEDILTLKTGPVQNSPPVRLSPEPSPWSPVKKKNSQGIGPYDCTKYSSGQNRINDSPEKACINLQGVNLSEIDQHDQFSS